MIIKINKFNETYVKVEAELSILRELGEHFTIVIPGGNFSRNRHWNGTVRLFRVRDRTIYKGLIPYVEAFAREKGYEVTFSDTSLSHHNEISLFEVEQFIKTLKLPVTPHKHQIDGVTHSMRNRRLMLVSPTASGKSLMLYIMIRMLLPVAMVAQQRLLLIVPTTNLVEQMYSDFMEYSLANGWHPEMYCHRIYSGQEKLTSHPVVISTWQSLANFPPEYFKNFFAVFGDEAHLCTASVLQTIIGNCHNAVYRIGTTGTIQDTKSHRLTLEGLFGLVYRPTTTSKLIEEKKLAEFQVKAVLLRHNPQVHFLEYKDELEYLISSEPRNRFIQNLAMSLDNNTLILYNFVEKHGMILKEMIDAVNLDGKKQVYLIYGGTPVEEVQRIRAEMEQRNDVILLASYMKFQIGANIKNLHNIIFASPSKSRIRVLQSIGRELRLHPSKKIAILFDIADELYNHDGKVNFILKHFAERIKIYHEEKLPYKLYKVEMK